MDTGRVVVFVNGDIPNMEQMEARLRADDVLVAVDGGLQHLVRLGKRPALLVGDLDSADADTVEQMAQSGVEVMRFPAEKDETDLELAIGLVLERGYRRIVLAGGLGGRLDQTLGNLFLLTLPELADRDIRMDDGREEVFLIRASAEVSGQAGDRVSLLPLSGLVEGVTTEELRYPLRGETLLRERTRGISNVMLAERARVRIQSGLLLCIHTRLDQRSG